MREEIRESTPNYWANVPLYIVCDNSIPPNAIRLYCVIASLSNASGYCWASNNYLAETFNVSKTAISLWIKYLKDAGYIFVELEYKNGSKEVEMRKIWPTWSIKDELPTINNNNNNTPTESHQSVKEEKYKDEIKEVIDYLNNKLNSNYRYKTESTNKLIRARLNDGFTVDNFKQVIDVKYDEWINKPEMVQYLRPMTLFGNKFEQYLNQKTYTTPQSQVTSKEWDGKFYSDEKF